MLAVMPPDIAAEAQALRREQEARQRQLMHERLFGHSSTSALSAILRSPGTEGGKWEGSGISSFDHMKLCCSLLYCLNPAHHPFPISVSVFLSFQLSPVA